MKSLSIIRHAKSSWSSQVATDLERPLNKRGRRDGPIMAKRFAARHESLDLLVSSPAARAFSTALYFADALGLGDDEVLVEEGLYHAGTRDVLRFIGMLDDSINRAALVAHNPTLTDLVNTLSDLQLTNLPTCGVVDLIFESESWREAASSMARDAFFDYPKRPRAE